MLPAVFVCLIIFRVLPRTIAQTAENVAETNASCLPEFSWMFNSRAQSPCQIASYLEAACNGGSWFIQSLPLNSHYHGPDRMQQNSCQCSSVTYSLTSACASCQRRKSLSWSEWNGNCSGINNGTYSPMIPANTTVPAWAYLPIQNDVWDPVAAQSALSAPESTGSLPSTISARTMSTPVIASRTIAALVRTKTDAGAIAGGVVGGLVALALVVGAAALFVSRWKRSKRIAPSTVFTNSIYSERHSDFIFGPPFKQEQHQHANANQHTQPGLYNPTDTLTFPVLHSQARDFEHHKPRVSAPQYNFVSEV